MKIEVDELIEAGELQPLHYLIVFTGFVVMLGDGYDLMAMSMVVPLLSEEWALPPSDFSGALSAALLGVLFGSGAAGWLGDRIGRRATVMITLLFSGVGMSVTPFVQDMDQLIAARFVTGAGAGGCIPVMLAYGQEHMPVKYRNALTVLLYSGAGMGSVVGGLFGPTLLETGGWALVFVVGGVASFSTILIVRVLIPESLRFQVLKNHSRAKIAAMLSRLSRAYEPSEDHEFRLRATEQAPKGALAELFRDRMAGLTAAVWIIFIANQFLVFYVSSWLPTWLTADGVSLSTALYVASALNAGGVLGGLAFGLIGDRLPPMRVLQLTYLLAAVFLIGLGLSVQMPQALFVFAFFAGAGVIGSSFLLGAVTPGFYPTSARSTGIGSALAIGRFGSISAPIIGGLLIAREFSTLQMLSVGSAVAIVAVAGAFAIGVIISRCDREENV